tara:strand:+ start:318 stop:554 length:237 start_codon:yes stop_codon:yes gene_type:complete
MSRLLTILAALLLVFGLLLLNDSQAIAWEHHAEHAREVGYPEPANWMFRLGQFLTPAAALWLGMRLAGKQRSRDGGAT